MTLAVLFARQVRYELKPFVDLYIWIGTKSSRTVNGAESLQTGIAIEAKRIHAVPLKVPDRNYTGLECAGDDGLRLGDH